MLDKIILLERKRSTNNKILLFREKLEQTRNVTKKIEGIRAFTIDFIANQLGPCK